MRTNYLHNNRDSRDQLWEGPDSSDSRERRLALKHLARADLSWTAAHSRGHIPSLLSVHQILTFSNP